MHIRMHVRNHAQTHSHARTHTNSSGLTSGAGCELIMEGLVFQIQVQTVHMFRCPWAKHWTLNAPNGASITGMTAATHWNMNEWLIVWMRGQRKVLWTTVKELEKLKRIFPELFSIY